MSRRCAVPRCSSQGATFHALPRRNPRRQLWLDALWPQGDLPYNLNIVVCSEHFTADSFIANTLNAAAAKEAGIAFSRTRLTSDAVPTLRLNGDDVQSSDEPESECFEVIEQSLGCALENNVKMIPHGDHTYSLSWDSRGSDDGNDSTSASGYDESNGGEPEPDTVSVSTETDASLITSKNKGTQVNFCVKALATVGTQTYMWFKCNACKGSCRFATAVHPGVR
ncbi:uncharacterized protein LOC135388423 [Ornithodoros turicata]|uniref:uncharacterized protein LOC135388423 n=1 Tax=Ornithodoros turicata TaxID=34597 RepID=UPI003139FFE9